MKTNHLLIALVLFAALLASCRLGARVGELRAESHSVERGDEESVRVEINLGAGDLEVKGGVKNLIEADFTYNVARLKPEVTYTDGMMVVQQPGTQGLPDLRNITDFRNEWDIRLNDTVPIDMRVEVGTGGSHLQLAGLSLTGLDVTLGAGKSTVDLNGDWSHDLDVTIDTGAADLTVRLPSAAGVRVEVDHGPTVINAPGLTQAGNVYTNGAYGVSKVSLRLYITTGIGWLNLELVDNG